MIYIPFLDICPKNTTLYSADICSAVFITALKIARKWKQPKYLSSSGWYMIMWNGIQFSCLLIRGIQETPETIQSIIVALGCLSWVEGNSLLLKTSWISGTGHGGFKLDLTWKAPPWEPALTVPEDAIEDDTGGTTKFLLNCYTHGSNNNEQGKVALKVW